MRIYFRGLGHRTSRTPIETFYKYVEMHVYIVGETFYKYVEMHVYIVGEG